MDKEIQKQIEQLIDVMGLPMFINTVVIVCGEKAIHVSTELQHASKGKIWEKNAQTLSHIVAELLV